jgi:hypothetical protein
VARAEFDVATRVLDGDAGPGGGGLARLDRGVGDVDGGEGRDGKRGN